MLALSPSRISIRRLSSSKAHHLACKSVRAVATLMASVTESPQLTPMQQPSYDPCVRVLFLSASTYEKQNCTRTSWNCPCCNTPRRRDAAVERFNCFQLRLQGIIVLTHKSFKSLQSLRSLTRKGQRWEQCNTLPP